MSYKRLGKIATYITGAIAGLSTEAYSVGQSKPVPSVPAGTTYLEQRTVASFSLGNINTKEGRAFYEQLEKLMHKPVTEDRLKKEGLAVTNYRGVNNILVNRDGMPVAEFHTDQEGIREISVPLEYKASFKKENAIEVTGRRYISDLVTRREAGGKPQVFDGNIYFINPFDAEGTKPLVAFRREKDNEFGLYAAFIDNDSTLGRETLIEVDRSYLGKDGDFGLEGKILLDAWSPQPTSSPATSAPSTQETKILKNDADIAGTH